MICLGDLGNPFDTCRVPVSNGSYLTFAILGGLLFVAYSFVWLYLLLSACLSGRYDHYRHVFYQLTLTALCGDWTFKAESPWCFPPQLELANRVCRCAWWQTLRLQWQTHQANFQRKGVLSSLFFFLLFASPIPPDRTYEGELLCFCSRLSEFCQKCLQWHFIVPSRI